MMRRDYIFMSDEQAQRILAYGPSKNEKYLRSLISEVSENRVYAEGLDYSELLLQGRLMFQIASRRFGSKIAIRDKPIKMKKGKQLDLPFEQ